TWHSNIAFTSGQFWLQWDRFQRMLIMPDSLKGKDLYTVDVINERRMHVLGELGSDDALPDILLRRDDKPSEDFQHQLNKAVGWGWDYEWSGASALAEARRFCVDLGTSAIRCLFDPAAGPIMSNSVPHLNGKPVLKPADQHELFANGTRQDVQM